MNYFIEIEGLKELEVKGKWNEAKELLYHLWSEDIVSIRYELDYLNFFTKSDYERKQITYFNNDLIFRINFSYPK